MKVSMIGASQELSMSSRASKRRLSASFKLYSRSDPLLTLKIIGKLIRARLQRCSLVSCGCFMKHSLALRRSSRCKRSFLQRSRLQMMDPVRGSHDSTTNWQRPKQSAAYLYHRSLQARASHRSVQVLLWRGQKIQENQPEM